jgi:hypothetical protein
MTADEFAAELEGFGRRNQVEIGNWLLHNTLLSRFVHGAYSSYENRGKLFKQSEQAGSAGVHITPVDGVVPENLRILRIENLPARNLREVKDIAKSKLGDGFTIVLKAGSQAFGLKAGDNVATLKNLIAATLPAENYAWYNLKSNAMFLHRDNISHLDAAVIDLIETLEKANAKLPWDKRVHFVSFQANSKSLYKKTQAVRALLQSKDGNLVFDKAALRTAQPDVIPTKACAIVGQLTSEAGLEDAGIGTQLLVDTGVLAHSRQALQEVLADGLNRVSKMPSLFAVGWQKTVRKYLLSARARKDPKLAEMLDADIDWRVSPSLARRLMNAVGHYISDNAVGELPRLYSQVLPDLYSKKFSVEYSRLINENGETVPWNTPTTSGKRVFMRPGDYICNFAEEDNLRIEGVFEVPSPVVPDPKAVVKRALWKDKRYRDLFDTRVLTDAKGKATHEFVEELLPDAILSIEYNTEKQQYEALVRGQLVLATRIPGTGESFALLRLKRRVSETDRTNVDTLPDQTVIDFGADADGDKTPANFMPMTKNGQMDTSRPAGRAFLYWAHDILHPQDSPRYLDAANGIIGPTRQNDPEAFKAAALEGQRAAGLSADSKQKWNTLSAVWQGFELPALTGAINFAARGRTGLMSILNNEQRLGSNANLEFEVSGVAFNFSKAPDPQTPAGRARINLLDRISGNISQSVVDVMAQGDAPYIGLTRETLGFVYAAMLANPHLQTVRNELNTRLDEQSPAQLATSGEGTLYLLQRYVFSRPAFAEALRGNTLFTQNKLRRALTEDKIYDLPQTVSNTVTGLPAWGHLAQLIRAISVYQDAYRDMANQHKRERIQKVIALLDAPPVAKKAGLRNVQWEADKLISSPGVAASVRAFWEYSRILSAQMSEAGAEQLVKRVEDARLLAHLGWSHKRYVDTINSIWERADIQDNAFIQILMPFKDGTSFGLEVSSDAHLHEVREGVPEAFNELDADLQTAILINALLQHKLQDSLVSGSYVGFIPVEHLKTATDWVAKLVELPALPAEATVEEAPAPARASTIPDPTADTSRMTPEQAKAKDTSVEEIKASLAAMEQAYFRSRQINPVAALHMETQLRASSVRRMMNDAILARSRIDVRSGSMKYQEGKEVLRAITAYIDSRDLFSEDGTEVTVLPITHEDIQSIPLTTVSDLESIVTVAENEKGEFQTSLTFRPKEGTPTIGSIVAAYEKLREKHPELASVDDLIAIGQKSFEQTRAEANLLKVGYAEHQEIARLQRRGFSGYVPHYTVFAFSETPDEMMNAALRKHFGAATEGTARTTQIIISAAEAAELGEKRRIPPLRVVLSEAASRSLRNLPTNEREAKVTQLLKQTQAAWLTAQEHGRLIHATTGRAQFRGGTLQEVREKLGRVPLTWDYGELLTRYASEVSQAAANIRHLNALGSLVDYQGTPAALFIPEAAPAGKVVPEKIFSDAHLRKMYNNLRQVVRRLPAYRDKVPEYQHLLTVGQNLRLLETAISSWLEQNDYEKVDASRLSGISHVWLRKGATRKLWEHSYSKGAADIKSLGLRRILRGVSIFNQFTKELSLMISFFHAFTLTESFVSGYGIEHSPMMTPRRVFNTLMRMRKTYKGVIQDPLMREVMNPWINAGLTFRFSALRDTQREESLQNYATDVDALLTKGVDFLDKSAVSKPLAFGLRTVRDLKRRADHFLWDAMQPTMKLMLAEHLLTECIGNRQYDDVLSAPGGEQRLRKDIASRVNDLFGGQDWTQHIWATPLVRDVLRASWFAPDWTLSNLRLAMVPDALQKLTGLEIPGVSQEEAGFGTNYMVTQYWPAFIGLVLMIAPTVLQAMIYAMFGDPDKDKLLMINNEAGKELSVDVTPLLRALGLSYGRTEQQRSYLQWGKSGYEILKWRNPFTAYLSKSSTTVRILWEQLTGTAAGDGFYRMPWADPHASKLGPYGFLAVDGSFWRGRLGYATQKALPMTLSGLLLHGRPPALFAPVSGGISRYRATVTIADVLYAYGKGSLRSELQGNPDKVQQLNTLVSGVLEDAWRNGGVPEDIMTQAKSMARGRYYKEMFDILNANPKNPNEGKLVSLASAVQRTDGAFSQLYKSVTDEYERRQRTIPETTQEALLLAWEKAAEQGEVTP